MYHSHSRDLDYFTLRNGRMFVWFSHALPHATKLSAKYAIILSYPIISYHILSYPFISYHILSITASRLPGLPNVEILVLHCSWKCCVALACWRL